MMGFSYMKAYCLFWLKLGESFFLIDECIKLGFESFWCFYWKKGRHTLNGNFKYKYIYILKGIEKIVVKKSCKLRFMLSSICKVVKKM